MSGDKVLSEAESIVQTWLHKNSYENSHKKQLQVNPTTSHEMDDIIISAFHKTDHGNISDAVGEILNGLRELPIEDEIIENVDKYLNPKLKDPRVGMEERQRKLLKKKREREERKDARQKEILEQESLRKKSGESKKDVKVEYHKQRIAEAVLNHQVNSFRQEVRREALNKREELTNFYSAKLKSNPNYHPAITPLDKQSTVYKADTALREAESIVGKEQVPMTDPPHLLVEAEELVSARETAIKLSHTRHVLIAQLEEANKLEAKENLQLMHHVFSLWHSLITENKMNLVRARTVEEWKTLCRVFSAWKYTVRREREAKERDQITEDMIRERRGDYVARKHFGTKLTRKCFASWRIWARNTGELRRHADRIREKRIKMAIFLEAAEKGKITQEKTPKHKSHPLDIPINVEGLFEKKIDVVTHKMVRDQIRLISEKEKKRKVKTDKQASTPAVAIEMAKCTEPVPKSISIIIPDIVPQDRAPLYVPPDPPMHPSHPKRFTTPIPLTQMEERNTVILQRKRDRQERMRALEEEKVTKIREEEATRLVEEEELRKADILKKQAEKRAQRHREVEKVMVRERLAMQNRKAGVHYERFLLRKYCLGGFVKFMRIQIRKGERADEFHRVRSHLEYFPLWVQALEFREMIKINNADMHYKKFRVKSAWRNWTAYVDKYKKLNELANEHLNRKIIHASLKAWKAYTREEIRIYLRCCVQSDFFFNRLIVRRSFRAIQRFIPIMHEEREREKRLEILREQVRQVLPDYGQN